MSREANRALSAAPDGSVLIEQSVVRHHFATRPRLTLVDPDGSLVTVWRAKNDGEEPEAGPDAIDGNWVVYLVDDLSHGSPRPSTIMAYNRSTGSTSRVAETRAVLSDHGYAEPVASGDIAYWESGAPTQEAITGESLDTKRVVYRHTGTTIANLLVLAGHVLWQSIGHGKGRLHAVGADNVPAFVATAIGTRGAISDGGGLSWPALGRGLSDEVRHWRLRGTRITTTRFTSAKGLNAQINYPYLQVAPEDLNPGQSSSVQNLRTGTTLQLTHALTLTLTAGNIAIFTGTTAQDGATTVYRASTRQLASRHC